MLKPQKVLIVCQSAHYLLNSRPKIELLGFNSILYAQANQFRDGEIQVSLQLYWNDSEGPVNNLEHAKEKTDLNLHFWQAADKISILQSCGTDPNISMIELLSILDILDHNGYAQKKVALCFSYLSYMRQDKNLLASSCGLRMIFKMLHQYNNLIYRTTVLDPHFIQWHQLPECKNLNIRTKFANYLFDYITDYCSAINTCIVLPDEGIYVRHKENIDHITKLGFEIIYMNKMRSIEGKITNHVITGNNQKMISAQSKTFLILDDILASGSTINSCIETLKSYYGSEDNEGVVFKFIALVSHLIYNAVLPKYFNSIDSIVTTNSIGANHISGQNTDLQDANRRNIPLHCLDILPYLLAD